MFFHKGLDCLDRIPDIPPDFDAAELPLLCQAPHHAGGRPVAELPPPGSGDAPVGPRYCAPSWAPPAWAWSHHVTPITIGTGAFSFRGRGLMHCQTYPTLAHHGPPLHKAWEAFSAQEGTTPPPPAPAARSAPIGGAIGITGAAQERPRSDPQHHRPRPQRPVAPRSVARSGLLGPHRSDLAQIHNTTAPGPSGP